VCGHVASDGRIEDKRRVIQPDTHSHTDSDSLGELQLYCLFLCPERTEQQKRTNTARPLQYTDALQVTIALLSYLRTMLCLVRLLSFSLHCCATVQRLELDKSARLSAK
jgi:hypothetical protein